MNKFFQKYHIDLPQSLMIGDSEVDMLAGKNAGCMCILIRNAGENAGNIPIGDDDYVVKDLLEAAKRVTHHRISGKERHGETN